MSEDQAFYEACDAVSADAPKPDLCAVCDSPVAKLLPIKPPDKPVRYVCESCYALFDGPKPALDFYQSYLRYECLRRLNPWQFEALWQRNLAGENFDEMVDERIKEGG